MIQLYLVGATCIRQHEGLQHQARRERTPHMRIADSLYSDTDWSCITPTTRPDGHSLAHRRTQHFGDIRVRMVTHSAAYLARHWCLKRQILFCPGGEMRTELQDGRMFTLTSSVSYPVATNREAH